MYAADVWDSGEPSYVPGWICPKCGEFVTVDEPTHPGEDRPGKLVPPVIDE
jgi:hypothetical protein